MIYYRVQGWFPGRGIIMVSYSDMAKVASVAASNTSSAAPTSKAEFGAQVVSKTLDLLNGGATSSAAPTNKAEFGAQVVSKTLDMLNTGKSKKKNSITPSYETQKTILSAGLINKGGVLSSIG